MMNDAGMMIILQPIPKSCQTPENKKYTEMSTADALEDDDMVRPRDASYIDSLNEPWKSIALRAIPPSGKEPLPPAAHRLDQLEVEVRSQFLKLFQGPSSNLQSIGDFWKSAVDFCYHLVYQASHNTKDDPRYHNMEIRKLPLVLIEDSLDGLSMEDCQDFWSTFVEPALDETLLDHLFWDESNTCHLPFLRVCNQFLKVLETASSSDEQEWRGRILCTLSKGFSIADRSAFKHWGSFHSSGGNNFETKEEFEQRGGKNSYSSALNNYSLYQAFWSLQADFSNPNRIQVGDFIKKMKTILTALESSASKRHQDTTPASSALRYMTSSSLLPTQLATSEFRSSVVAQFLIVASHLSSESAPLGNALKALLDRARKLLQADNSQLYRILWDSILSNRESHWRKWKKEKCPAKAFAPKRKLDDKAEDDMAKKRPRLLDGPLGNDSSDKEQVYELLSKGDLIKISQELVKTVPSLEHHLEPYVDALDPEAGIEDDYHPKNNALFSWRAMRLYAKHQLPLLKSCRKPADLERITRKWYQTQGKEIPGEMPLEELESDNDSEGGSSRRSSDNSSSDEKEDEDEKVPVEDDIEMKDDLHLDEEDDNREDMQVEETDRPSEENAKESVPGEADEKIEGEEEPEIDAEIDAKKPQVGEGDTEEHPSKEDPEPEAEKFVDKDDDMEDGETPAGETGSDKDEKVPHTHPGEGEEPHNEKEEVDKDGETRKEATPPSSPGESAEDEGEVEISDKKRSPEQPAIEHNSRSNSRDRNESSPPPPQGRTPQPPSRGGRLHEAPLPNRGGRHNEGPGPKGGRRDAGRGGRRNDGPGRSDEGRRDDGPGRRDEGKRDDGQGRRDNGPPPRGGRRDDGPANRGGRRDDGPGRRDDGPPPRGGRRDGRRDDGPPPRGGRGDRSRRGGGGRDEGRFGRRRR